MSRNKTILLVVACLIVFGWVAYEITYSVIVAQTTGAVQINTSDPSAIITISGLNSQDQQIGKNNVLVRLKPGTYLLGAYDETKGVGIMSSVTVQKKHSLSKSLDINSKIQLVNKYDSVISKLPVSGPASEYNIGYSFTYKNGQSVPIITVSYTSQKSKQDALNWIDYWALDPSVFIIKYIHEASSVNGNLFAGG